MTKDEALDLALETLESIQAVYPCETVGKRITAIKQARSAPVQPVAIPEYVRKAATNLHENEFREQIFIRAIVGWINSTPPAQPAPVQEPFGYLFQHEETGLTTVVDVQQVDWGFEKNNPRHQKIGPVYTTPPAAPVQPVMTDEKGRPISFWGGKSVEPIKQPAPASWMETVTANLVREGVNKHKARELAEHFYGLAQRPFVGLTDEEMREFDVDPVEAKLMIAKLKEKNT